MFRAARISVVLVLGLRGAWRAHRGTAGGQGLGTGVTVKFGAMIALALAIGFVQFRHPGLALSVALAPIPAVALALLISAQQAMPSRPLLPVIFRLPSGLFHVVVARRWLCCRDRRRRERWCGCSRGLAFAIACDRGHPRDGNDRPGDPRFCREPGRPAIGAPGCLGQCRIDSVCAVGGSACNFALVLRRRLRRANQSHS